MKIRELLEATDASGTGGITSPNDFPWFKKASHPPSVKTDMPWYQKEKIGQSDITAKPKTLQQLMSQFNFKLRNQQDVGKYTHLFELPGRGAVVKYNIHNNNFSYHGPGGDMTGTGLNQLTKAIHGTKLAEDNFALPMDPTTTSPEQNQTDGWVGTNTMKPEKEFPTTPYDGGVAAKPIGPNPDVSGKFRGF